MWKLKLLRSGIVSAVNLRHVRDPSRQMWTRLYSSGKGTMLTEVLAPGADDWYVGDEGVVAEILKKPGDQVKVDEHVAVIEADGKATMYVASTKAGMVQEVLVKEGEKVEPGQKLIILKSGCC